MNTSFTSFITEAPTATTPLGIGDLVPVIQGGVTKHILPNSTFLNLNLGNALSPTSLVAALDWRSTAPINDKALFTIQHTTGTTPMTGGHIYGGLINAQQLVRSTAAIGDPASYVGLFGTATGRAVGGEGGFATTLSGTTAGGGNTLTLTSTTGFVDGLRMQVVLDNGLVQPVDQVGAPVGSVITLAQNLNSIASSGAIVYVWHGAIKGLGAQGSLTTGSVGMLLGAAEFSMSAQTGSLPYIRNILGVTSNSDDDVQALGPYDSGFFLSRELGAIGYKTGIAFTPISGINLVSATGTLIKTFGGGYATGLDFSQSAFTNYSFKAPGITIDGTGLIRLDRTAGGQIVFNNTDLTPTTGGLWRFTGGSGAGSLASQVNTAVAGDFATVNTPMLLTLQGDVMAAGLPTAIPTNSTGKFLFVPTMTGKPSGTPTNAAAGHTAIVVNTTNHQLCWYEQATAAWYCVTGTTPP